MKIIVPVSGGKDSQATLDIATRDKRGLEVIPVFNYTGWDHPDTYEHLEKMVSFYGLALHKTVLKETPTMEDLVKKLGRFPGGAVRSCTSYFKMTAFRRFLDTVEGNAKSG